MPTTMLCSMYIIDETGDVCEYNFNKHLYLKGDDLNKHVHTFSIFSIFQACLPQTSTLIIQLINRRKKEKEKKDAQLGVGVP